MAGFEVIIEAEFVSTVKIPAGPISTWSRLKLPPITSWKTR